MEIHRFSIAGPIEFVPRKIEDARGYFSELFRMDAFEKEAGTVEFLQDNQSLSLRRGTIRGVHFQAPPRAQGKLVRCVAGSALDVAVDLRHNSSTYGRWISVLLRAETNNQLWIPAGFGHGFCTLEPKTIIGYRATDYYSPEHGKGVSWDDLAIGINWPTVADPETLSDNDRKQPSLAALPIYFSMESL